MDDKKLLKWIEKTDDSVKQISMLRTPDLDEESKFHMNQQLDTIIEQIDKLIIKHSEFVELKNCMSRTTHAKKLLNLY